MFRYYIIVLIINMEMGRACCQSEHVTLPVARESGARKQRDVYLTHALLHSYPQSGSRTHSIIFFCMRSKLAITIFAVSHSHDLFENILCSVFNKEVIEI